MRADRLLSILLLLQTHGRMTARTLAERLEVSERTIYRDMEALGIAGVPIFSERGSNGGWELVEGYQTHLTGLSASEIQALFATRPARVLSDLGLREASEAALIKLLAALPSASREGAEHVRSRLHVDPAGWSRPDEDVSALSVLQDAVWRDRRVRFTYLRGDGGPSERSGDALGLVAKGSVWYLVASVDGEPRTYRVSRIRDAVVVDESARWPDGFDLAEYWQRSSIEFRARLPRYEAMMRVEPNVLKWMTWTGRYARIERRGEPNANGWVDLALAFQVEEEAIVFAMSYGARVEVVSPPELRERVRERIFEAAAKYERD